ncbi:uncharacterized protein K444DRAFT_614271 [Hyaloscypha bicolor E]|uniref:FAD-binding domain-containing protein n=1 Tax=Hyaloscypha bicolor E TaxID=1095630 RepID=A0A2J6T653_9HELO|nr:uncharacterized protein K444DRAFT_614271 [Hyaloscypha bicolor E]PMD58500.1 hypothetical protein K444DRAFT_614271 [Hyaloscypha bicolor E]
MDWLLRPIAWFELLAIPSYARARDIPNGSREGVIIGDTAHASKPNGGQGGSLSLEDAATLAIAIKKAIP